MQSSGILKPENHDSSILEGTCPMEVDPRMHEDDLYDPPTDSQLKIFSGRSLAIAEYKRRELEENTHGAVSPARCMFSSTSVSHFSLLDPPYPVAQYHLEEIKLTDPLEPVAARALDRLIFQQQMARPMTLQPLDEELNKFHAIPDQTSSINELKRFMCQQGQDLIERCEARLIHLPETPQFNPRHEMRLATERWESEDEAAYHEKLLTRIPDALTQRFLRYRASVRAVGLDATPHTLRILKDVIMPALQAEDALGKRCRQ